MILATKEGIWGWKFGHYHFGVDPKDAENPPMQVDRKDIIIMPMCSEKCLYFTCNGTMIERLKLEKIK